MKTPSAELIRARAKASLIDLLALHLSSAGIESIRHLDLCHQLRSLYADSNRIKDIEGLLVLRNLWRIDLSHNQLHKVDALSSFSALGFVYLDQNQINFADLVCLRDVHILELRLNGNPGLEHENTSLQYRMKVVALLQNVWILDGHYISTGERVRAIEAYDSYVQYLLQKHLHEGDSSNKLQFGSTAWMWDGSVANKVGNSSQNMANKLLRYIRDQPIHNTSSIDLYRARALADFHNEECIVHNTHCKFAASKFSNNGRIMPKLYLQEVLSLPKDTRLKVAVILAAFLEFRFTRAITLECLTIELLDFDQFSSTCIDETVSLPPYALTVLLCLLRNQSIEEADSKQSANVSSVVELSSTQDMWKSMPSLFTTLIAFDKESRVSGGIVEPHFAARCQFAVQLLSKASSFPDDSPKRSTLLASKSRAKILGVTKARDELLELIKYAAQASSSNDAIRVPLAEHDTMVDTSDTRTSIPLEQMDTLIISKTSSVSLTESRSAPQLEGTAIQRPPKVGDWVQIQSGLPCWKIHHVTTMSESSSDPILVNIVAPTDSKKSAILHLNQLTRISNTLWRLVNPADAEQLLASASTATPSTPSVRVGKLHRDSDAFHHHGAARSQGFPNHLVTEELVAAMQDQELPTEANASMSSVAKPVEIFTANDTLDSNYVLTSAPFIAAQNYCAMKVFKQQQRTPAGLWNPIKTAAPYNVLDQTSEQPDGRRIAPLRGQQSESSRQSRHNSVKSASPERSNSIRSIQDQDDWGSLKRAMQTVLGLLPEEEPSSPHTYMPSAQTDQDVRCFLTSVDASQDQSLCLAPNGTHTQVQGMPSSRFGTGKRRNSSIQQKQLAPVSWHRVATKPQLLVLRHSCSSLPEPSPACSSSASPTSSASAASTHGPSAMRAPVRVNVVLPTLSTDRFQNRVLDAQLDSKHD